MRTNSSTLGRVGKKLQAHFDSIVSGPLPQRWVDLINWLNEKERAEAETEARRHGKGQPVKHTDH